MKLTEAIIPTLRTDKIQADIMHDTTPSAGIRLTKEGRKTFFIKYRSPVLRTATGQSKQRRYYFGEHKSGLRGRGKYITLKEFEREYDIFRGELAKGNDPQAFETSAEGEEEPARVSREEVPEFLRKLYPDGYRKGTVAALLAKYFEKKAKRSLAPRTLEKYMQPARTYILTSPLATMRPEAVGAPEVRTLLTCVTDKAPQVARHVKKVLSVAFEYGIAHCGLKFNPAMGAPITVPKNRRKRWLPDEELALVLSAFDQLSDAKAVDVYTLILHSACRPGEAAGVKAQDIVTMNGERVWKIRGKNGHDHIVPLIGRIGEIINRRYLEAGGKGPLFWRYDTKSEYPQELRDANKELRALTQGIEAFRPHDFRRTARTHFSSLGITAEVAEALLNHVQDEIEGTYNIYDYWIERKQALTIWNDKLNSLRKVTVTEHAA